MKLRDLKEEKAEKIFVLLLSAYFLIYCYLILKIVFQLWIK